MMPEDICTGQVVLGLTPISQGRFLWIVCAQLLQIEFHYRMSVNAHYARRLQGLQGLTFLRSLWPPHCVTNLLRLRRTA
jgi:hypothetical protein